MSFFNFRDFRVRQTSTALKVGTDAMIFGAIIDVTNSEAILDIGTGTGVLSLMVAQKSVDAKVSAIETDASAVQDARYNFENSPYKNRLELFHGDFLDFSFEKKFDQIITNPPFYSDLLIGKDKSLNLAKHVSKLTPSLLFDKVSKLLYPKGSFWIIWPSENEIELIRIAEENNLHLKTIVRVFGKPKLLKRVVLEFVFNVSVVHESELIIRNAAGGYSEDYIRLTKDFHDRIL